MNYSGKFWQNIGYAQEKLRKHGELLSVKLLEECVDEIRGERRRELDPERNRVGGFDGGFLVDILVDGIERDDPETDT